MNTNLEKNTGTKEWAAKNFNFINGCLHDCKYCYAKAIALRFKRKTSENWQIEELKEEVLTKRIKKINGKIMFPSSHDITPKYLNYAVEVMRSLLESGNEVLVVTKPHFECIQKLCSEFHPYKDQILFRFTIGSMNSDTLKFWEPNAPDFNERFNSLKYAYNQGYKTSISCEPMLDNKSDEFIEVLMPFVTDSIWFGKPNRLESVLGMNGQLNENGRNRAKLLKEDLSDDFIHNLFNTYKSNSKIKWKDSIKKVVGLEMNKEAGLDQ